MAVTVGELAVQLEARTAEFRSAIKKSERQLEGFEKTGNKTTAAVSSSFKGLAGPIIAVGTALAGLGAIRVGQQIAANAIEGAAAFEGYEVRLRALLGSQEDANKSLEAFVALSTETPFAVAQVVSGATTLASVAGGNREALEELTATAANLAAVTGLSFEESAGNLQRALASGIGAADLFRDRGVRKLIESISGIPDLTKIPLEEQRQAFIDTFGPNELAPFGDAAEQLSNTLGGALSNIADASDNASRALGAALAPAAVATARGVMIPFFQTLQRVVEENEGSITKFAVDGIGSLLEGLASTLETGADILEFFDQFGLDLGDIVDVLGIVSRAFGIFFDAVGLGLQTLNTLLIGLADLFAPIAQALGLIDEAEAELLSQARIDAFDALAESAGKFGEGLAEDLAIISVDLENIVEDGDKFADGLRKGADAARAMRGDVEAIAGTFAEDRRQRAAATDSGAGEAAAGGGFAFGAGGFGTETAAEIDDVLSGFDDSDVGSDLAQALLENDAVRDAQQEYAAGLAETTGAAIGDGLAAAFSDEGIDFAAGLAELSGTLLDDALGAALENLEQGLADLLAEVDFSGIGGEGLGGGFGAALGVAAGIGGQLVANALEGTDTNVGSQLAESAVTSTQAVRGIVAGSVNIPILEVGNFIRDANAVLLRETQTTNSLLRTINASILAVGLRGSGGNEGGFADEVSREFSQSVALG